MQVPGDVLFLLSQMERVVDRLAGRIFHRQEQAGLCAVSASSSGNDGSTSSKLVGRMAQGYKSFMRDPFTWTEGTRV